MCGDIKTGLRSNGIAEAFRLGIPPTLEILPSYSIAPQTLQPIVRLSRDTAERELAQLRWGLVPFFAKDAKVGYSTVNARAETVTTSPVFRGIHEAPAMLGARKRGFHEWQKLGNKAKQPWTIEFADGEVFAFAGLWERVEGPDDKQRR